MYLTMARDLRILFSLLIALMLSILLYAFLFNHFPFFKQLITPWMVATLTGFYINVGVLCAWVAYKEENWISSVIWIMLLICFGSIATCAYIIVQLLKLTPSQESSQHLMYYVLSRYRNGTEKQFFAVTQIFFSILGAVMLGTLVYTVVTDGSPFRIELFTPWMIATLIDFYINLIILCAWVAHKEANWISSILWIMLLICFRSIATCAYIAVKLSKLTSSQASSEDLMYYILLRSGTELKTKYSFVVTLRILFSILGAVMLGTLAYTVVTGGSPFRIEILTPWMRATLVDFYTSVFLLAIWVAYKESSWICAVFWIILLICYGSIATCIYVVWQLFEISCYEPTYFILVNHSHRAGLTDV